MFGFIEFCASKDIEDGPYADLIEKLVDRFHEVRPQDNWLVTFLNMGIVSIFGGVNTANKENAMRLDKPSLGRIKQYFSVVQHTTAKYPSMITRLILENQGLLLLLFWMLENPYKAINRKAHQTFHYFFLQPQLLANEPFLTGKVPAVKARKAPAAPDSDLSPAVPNLSPPETTSYSSHSSLPNTHHVRGQLVASSTSAAHTPHVPPQMPIEKSDPSGLATQAHIAATDTRKKSKAKEAKKNESGTFLLDYIPSTFTEEILPYYWKLTLENYPDKTRGESLLVSLTVLLSGALLPTSPLIPYILESLVAKLVSMRLSKNAAELTRIVMSLVGIVPQSVLPLLLSLIQDYIAQCPKRLQRFLCATLLDTISKNCDYTRKEMCTNWYLHLVDSLTLRARL